MRSRNGSSSFRLRIPRPTFVRATEIASDDGVSINQFITLAVAEGIERMKYPRKAVHDKRSRDQKRDPSMCGDEYTKIDRLSSIRR